MSTVPYYVLTSNKSDDHGAYNDRNGRTKAIFTVPESLVSNLIAYPILCRGGAFQLQLDEENNKIGSNNSNKIFVSTEYYSPEPEQTALEISRRLAGRVKEGETAAGGDSIASVLGL